MVKGICPGCCWYNTNTDKCDHPQDEPDPDFDGKVGIVLGCDNFLEGKMEDPFKTFTIKFGHRESFSAALELNNLADDIGYSDMILTYSNKYFRDRFAGYLKIEGIFNFQLGD